MKYALSYQMAWAFFLLAAILFAGAAATSMLQIEQVSVALSAAAIVLALFGIYMAVESWEEKDPEPPQGKRHGKGEKPGEKRPPPVFREEKVGHPDYRPAADDPDDYGPFGAHIFLPVWKNGNPGAV